LGAATLGSHLARRIRNGYSPICPEKPTGIWTLSLAAVTGDGFDPAGAKPAPLGDAKVRDFMLSPNDLVVSRSNTPDRVGLAGIYNGVPGPLRDLVRAGNQSIFRTTDGQLGSISNVVPEPSAALLLVLSVRDGEWVAAEEASEE
jgi:hypothetical protein